MNERAPNTPFSENQTPSLSKGARQHIRQELSQVRRSKDLDEIIRIERRIAFLRKQAHKAQLKRLEQEKKDQQKRKVEEQRQRQAAQVLQKQQQLEKDQQTLSQIKLTLSQSEDLPSQELATLTFMRNVFQLKLGEITYPQYQQSTAEFLTQLNTDDPNIYDYLLEEVGKDNHYRPITRLIQIRDSIIPTITFNQFAKSIKSF